MSKGFIFGLLVGLIPFILQLFVKDIYGWLKNKGKSIFLKDFIWHPQEPLYNKGAKKDVNQHGADVRINFDNNSLDFENFVQGEECLLQHLITYINTPKGEYEIYEGTDFGNEFANTIFTEENPVEFQRQCEKMAHNIIELEHYQDYIEKIYRIYRKKSDLYIEMKLCGNPKTVICKIPNIKKS